MNGSKIGFIFVGICSFLGGFVVGSEMVKKSAQRIALEEFNRLNNESKEPENAVESSKNDEKSQDLDKMNQITTAYRSSLDLDKSQNDDKSKEKTDVKEAAETGDLAENATPFRSTSDVELIPESTFIAADKRVYVEYYAGEDAFYDDYGDRFNDPSSLFGNNILDRFGTTSDDPDLVHVYNRKKGCYYEIARKEGSFDPK